MDPYEALGVAPTATDGEIRASYLRLARRHHPDSHAAGDPQERSRNESRMQEINAAWAVLGDPRRRRAHDADRRAAAAGGASSTIDPEDDPYRFEPFDDEFDDGFTLADEPGVRTHGRALSVTPALLFAVGVVSFIVGGLTGLLPLVGLAALCLVFSVLGFLIVPFIALSASKRAEQG